MAAVTHGVSLTDPADLSIYTTASFTPALNDLLVVFVYGRATDTDPATMTDTQGGTYTQILAIDSGVTADTLYLFVRDSLTPNAAMTITFDCTGDSALGCIILVERVSGMTRVGSDAVLQTATEELQATGTTPNPAFAANADTNNPTLGFVGNQVNPATMTPPTNWTELDDVGVVPPTLGGETVHRDSGFTGTMITWGSTSGEVYGDIIVELDTSAPVVLLDGTAAAVSSLAGVLPVDREMVVTVAATSALAGALPVDKKLAATVVAASTLAGELTIAGEQPLDGVIAATSALTGELPVERLMVSTVAAVSTLDAVLGKYRAINGSIDAVSTLAGDLQRLRALTGAIAGGSTLAGALKLELALRGVLAGISALPGSIKVEREITALVAASASLSGSLSVSAVGVAWTRERLLTAKDISGPALRAPHRKEIE